MRFVDATRIFESEKTTFQSFITGIEESSGIAIRIENTCLWILICDYARLINCNQFKTSISRNDFKKIP